MIVKPSPAFVRLKGGITGCWRSRTTSLFIKEKFMCTLAIVLVKNALLLLVTGYCNRYITFISYNRLLPTIFCYRQCGK